MVIGRGGTARDVSTPAGDTEDGGGGGRGAEESGDGIAVFTRVAEQTGEDLLQRRTRAGRPHRSAALVGAEAGRACSTLAKSTLPCAPFRGRASP